MKLFTAIAVAMLSLPFGATAFAQSNPSGLTRADVMAQLQQAQAEGFVPAPKDDYPPSEATIARNREIYAIQHGGDGAGAVKTAGVQLNQAVPAAN
ncbi:DUF4148 domain-containing protein [Paraburkholderia domus]|uniref:DUF4148 domain-containing protein n=1 Tax=Paraburkholderia domus TaxID=2793075 RepID=A0A9N8MN56_9BURK|nr:DUF4148 domain-containing protein [Paraburkholderia domus]MBK5121843.1 DUF4148 domain-containing protein [Burkholderia sp. R-69980]MBK5164557.1 DUF4148 domain-containing protein [Burkholderia sp. R-70211]CAE6875187.1 hypothetical protein R70211_01630 [Paraburkholderia domus]CAE6903360.1 hypothetical protein R75471_03103 [Paraburkholderia domus]